MRLKDSYVIVAALTGAILFWDFYTTLSIEKSIGIDVEMWATIAINIAMFLGIVNLSESNIRRLSSEKANSQQKLLSMILLVSMYGTIVAGFWWKPLYSWVFQYIYNNIYSAMYAMLGPYILVASYRTLKPRNLEATVFLIAAVVLIVLNIPITSILLPRYGEIFGWVKDVTITGGSRGLMICLTIGSAIFGLRVLLGHNRRILGGE